MPSYYISIPKTDVTEDFDLFIIGETDDSYEMLKVCLDTYENQPQKIGRILNLQYEFDIKGCFRPYPDREHVDDQLTREDKAIMHYEIYNELPRGTATYD